ncbi:putative amidophosphoribosyltransferase precursor [Bacteroides heparinolyticus]|uniref:Putative amidophosphoribosyltransferase n=1 Tax=Prevotella heparinolytica TaxID=28113 RepID=A0A449I084_9BACE|nr:putative amidophosphoribosyltransferase precursor [Bacteroides heparinolyticus]
MLLLTEDGIIAARDHWGRTPVVIGKKEGAYAVTSESSSFPNLGYEIERYLGPVRLSVCEPMAWNRCASLMSKCKSVRSYGYIMVFPLLATKAET